MSGEAKILHLLLRPNNSFKQLKQLTEVEGIVWRIVLILCVSGLLTGLSYFAAFHSMENISFIKDAKLTQAETGLVRYMVAIAGVFWGILKPICFSFISSILFLLFFRDVGIKKLIALFLLVYILFLVNEAMSIPYQWMAGTESSLSPLGLGFIGNIIFHDGFCVAFFNEVNVVTGWSFLIVYAALKHLSFKSDRYCIGVTSSLFLLYILAVSFSASITSGQF